MPAKSIEKSAGANFFGQIFLYNLFLVSMGSSSAKNRVIHCLHRIHIIIDARITLGRIFNFSFQSIFSTGRAKEELSFYNK